MRIAITVLTLILLASQVYGYRLWGEFSTEITMHLAQPILGGTPEIYGGWRTWHESACRSNPLYGSPFMDIYILGEELKYKGFILHFKHYCAHTVNSTYKVQNDRNGNESFIF